MVATLYTIGWQPVSFSEWHDHVGNVWSIPLLSESVFSPHLLIYAMQDCVATQLWRQASTHFQGAGLEEGRMKDIIQDAMDMSREEFDAKWKGEFDYDQLNKDYNDDLEEGKLPAGLQAYQDKKNGKKDDADKDDEEVDEDKEDKEEVDEALEDIKRLAGIEIAEGAKIDCPCCKGGKDSCSTGKDVCGTCDGTGKVDEAYEAVVETVADEMVENTIDLAMKELRQLAGI